jgi:hypothetical protein
MSSLEGLLDFSADGWTLTVNGTDYSPYVQNGSSLQWSLIPNFTASNPNIEPMEQIGSITLAQVERAGGTQIDFDPLTNGDFKEENLVVFNYESVTVKARIKSAEPEKYDPKDFSITSLRLNLTDKLGLINKDFPAQNPATFLSGSSPVPIAPGINVNVVTWYAAIVRELTGPTQYNGVPYFTPSQIITAGLPTNLKGTSAYGGGSMPDGFDSAQGGAKNPARSAATKAALRQYWLYCDPATEEIRFAKYPLSPNAIAPSRQYALAQVRMEPPEAGIEEVSDDISTATIQRSKSAFKLLYKDRLKEWPVSTPVIAPHPTTGEDLEVEVTTELAPSISDSRWSQTVTVTKRKFYGFPDIEDLATNTDTYTSLTFTRFINYNSDGLTTSEGEEDIYQAKGELSDDYPGDTTPIGPGSDITTYAYANDGRPTLKRKIVRKPKLSVFPSSVVETPIIAEQIETPYDLLANGKIKTFDRKLIPRGLTPIGVAAGTEDESLTPDPDSSSKAQYIDAIEKPGGAKTDESAATLTSSSGRARGTSLGGRSGRTIRITIPGGGAESAATYSRMAFSASQHGRILRSYDRPLESNENLAPLQREDIGSFILLRDGAAIEWMQGGVKAAFTGRQMGTLSTPITVPVRPFLPTGGTLEIAAISAATFTLNVPIIPIPLVAGGGTPPYVFTAATALPTGLSISGSEIIGSPTVASSGSTTIQVEDDALGTDTTPFSWSVVALPASATHYGFISTGGARIRARTGGIGTVLTIPDNAITDAAGTVITDAAGVIITDAS